VSEEQVFQVPQAWAERAHMDAAGYDAAWTRVQADPEGFWSEVAGRLDWIKAPTKIKDVSFNKDDFHIRWFEDGVLNVSANCLDPHLPARADEVAFIWEGDDPSLSKTITYREAHEEVCRMANVLKAQGVAKGDRVTIYLPMIPEAAYAMLACARIGAVHSVVFGGFSPDSLAGRIEDCGSKIVITADEGLRGGKRVPLKANVDAALERPGAGIVQTVLVIAHTRADTPMIAGRDVRYESEAMTASVECRPEPMNAEEPLFILYTSGSTGKPKGVVHVHGGYLTGIAETMRVAFDAVPGDVMYVVADPGWITGQSYLICGALCTRVTSLVVEAAPVFPSAGRFASIIERFRVKAGGPGSAARSLSGGNLQKFIMGREIDANPKVLIVAQPTWGVDVGAAAQIRAALLSLRDAGCAVLVVSEELDELFELSDRLMVIAKGRMSPPVARTEASVGQIGEWMSGLWPGAVAPAEAPAAESAA
jgi:acetyl-CoA synthetase